MLRALVESSVLLRGRPAAAPGLDSRFPGSAVNPSFVPKHWTTILRGTIRRVLGLRYPRMPADVANGNPHRLPAHITTISHSVRWT